MKGLLDVLSGKNKVSLGSMSFGNASNSFGKVKSNSLGKVNMDWRIKGFKSDFDGDGVLDHKDCKPFDKKRQHFKPNDAMLLELVKLPIFFVGRDEDINGWRWLYGIGVDDYGKLIYLRWHNVKKKPEEILRVPQRVHATIQRFFKVVKQRPDIIKNIKRRKTYVVFTSGINKDDIMGHIALNARYAVVNLIGRKGIPFGYQADDEDGSFDIEEGAGTVHHELEHIKQFHTKSPSRKYGRPTKVRKNISQINKREKDAGKAERREQIRRYRYPSEKKMEKGVKGQYLQFDELGGHWFK